MICDGAPAENRAKWLMENKGMNEGEAQAFVIGEFPNLFDKSAPSSGHFVDGKFPHTLELVKDDAGKKQIEVRGYAVQPREHYHDRRALQRLLSEVDNEFSQGFGMATGCRASLSV